MKIRGIFTLLFAQFAALLLRRSKFHDMKENETNFGLNMQFLSFVIFAIFSDDAIKNGCKKVFPFKTDCHVECDCCCCFFLDCSLLFVLLLAGGGFSIFYDFAL